MRKDKDIQPIGGMYCWTCTYYKPDLDSWRVIHLWSTSWEQLEEEWCDRLVNFRVDGRLLRDNIG
jgi:hypothetical protein